MNEICILRFWTFKIKRAFGLKRQGKIPMIMQFPLVNSLYCIKREKYMEEILLKVI